MRVYFHRERDSAGLGGVFHLISKLIVRFGPVHALMAGDDRVNGWSDDVDALAGWRAAEKGRRNVWGTS